MVPFTVFVTMFKTAFDAGADCDCRSGV